MIVESKIASTSYYVPWASWKYVDDVVFFANMLGSAQNLVRALEEFCIHIGQVSIALKQKLCLWKKQNKDNHELYIYIYI